MTAKTTTTTSATSKMGKNEVQLCMHSVYIRFMFASALWWKMYEWKETGRDGKVTRKWRNRISCNSSEDNLLKMKNGKITQNVNTYVFIWEMQKLVKRRNCIHVFRCVCVCQSGWVLYGRNNDDTVVMETGVLISFILYPYSTSTHIPSIRQQPT